MQQTIVFALAASLAGSAAAQQIPRADPADPSVRVERPAYNSAFAGYRAYKEEDLARWRDRNQEVGRLGGHVGHVGRAKPAPKPAAAAGERK